MVQCVCGEILPRDKNALQRHEAKVHDYNIPQYKAHTPKRLSKVDFDKMVAQGEEKFRHALIDPNESSNTGHGQNDNTKEKEK